MENAAKALLIAGGILIAMLVLSLGVILITTYGEIGSAYDQTLSMQEIQNFNSTFSKFEGRNNITAQEIVSLVNYVREYNSEMGTNIRVKVSNSYFEEKQETHLIEFIKDNSTKVEGNVAKIIYFECTKISHDNEGKVNEIQFE